MWVILKSKYQILHQHEFCSHGLINKNRLPKTLWPMKCVIISKSNNVSLPVWHQGITWTEAEWLQNHTLRTNIIEIWLRYKKQFLINAFEVIVWKTYRTSIMLGLHRTPEGLATNLRQKMAKFAVTRELVGKVICLQFVNQQKVIS